DTVTASFPAAANSGQNRATAPSGSILPCSRRRAATAAATPLPTEKALTSVSPVHALVRPASAHPPHRSTTVRPSIDTQTAPPCSSRWVKLRTNSSLTAANRGSHVPPTFTP